MSKRRTQIPLGTGEYQGVVAYLVPASTMPDLRAHRFLLGLMSRGASEHPGHCTTHRYPPLQGHVSKVIEYASDVCLLSVNFSQARSSRGWLSDPTLRSGDGEHQKVAITDQSPGLKQGRR